MPTHLQEARAVRPPVLARRVVTRPGDVEQVARELAAGAVVAVAFANFYALTTRADLDSVRKVNTFKGRPAGQVGSITAPPSAIPALWDLDRLPAGLTASRVLEVVDALFGIGPFGFRGPAAPHIPGHLTSPDAGVTTAQVIAPGHACPANRFFTRAMVACGDDFLYVTSANLSHHLTRGDDSPAHWRAAGLVAEFGDQPGFVLLEHDDEAAVRRRYPAFLPMSTSVLSFHSVRHLPGDRRPHLPLERHGSLAVEPVRAVLAGLGFGLVVALHAKRRLAPRTYATPG